MNITIYSLATGQILRTVQCQEQDLLLQYAPDTEGCISGNHPDDLFYIAAGVPTPLPEQPTNDHTFNWQTKQWEDARTLQDLKDSRRAYINTERLRANQSNFSHLGKLIAADALSRSDIDAINGEVNNTGEFPVGWPGAWKCIDNTWLPIGTTQEWKSLYTSMVNQGTANFGRAQELKLSIESASTAAEVEAVVW
jgi:hypothetical protein